MLADAPLIKLGKFSLLGENPEVVKVPEGVHIVGPELPQYWAEAKPAVRKATINENNVFMVLLLWLINSSNVGSIYAVLHPTL